MFPIAINDFAVRAGQEAAEKIFDGKAKKPLDKPVTKKGPAPKKAGKK